MVWFVTVVYRAYCSFSSFLHLWPFQFGTVTYELSRHLAELLMWLVAHRSCEQQSLNNVEIRQFLDRDSNS